MIDANPRFGGARVAVNDGPPRDPDDRRTASSLPDAAAEQAPPRTRRASGPATGQVPDRGAEDRPAPEASSPLLLLVEDEPAVAHIVGRVLSRAGFRVVHATRISEARAILSAQVIDIMLLDYRLPDGRADRLYTDAVRLQPALAVSTVFLTGDLSETTEASLAATGCPFLAKPFSIDALVKAVQHAAKRGRHV
ncbi:MAG: pilR [Gemmatimonadetes bacterium]|nr:pilR [Gemmatimonadota bacterium]